MRLVEVNLEKQGRPKIEKQPDMDAGFVPSPPGAGQVIVHSYYSLTERTADYTASTRTVILADCSSGGITVNLPAASGMNSRFFTVKKIDSSSNKVTISPNGSETIDGESYIELNDKNQYVTIISHGARSEWFIIGGEYMGLEQAFRDEIAKLMGAMEEVVMELRKSNIHFTNMTDDEVDECELN